MCYSAAMSANRAVLFVLALSVIVWSLRRASGRLAPRAAFAPIAFLATRWPVLIGTCVGALAWLWILIPPMIAKGRDTPQNYAMMLGISVLCGAGAALMVVGPIFFLSRLFVRVPDAPLETGEAVVRELAANHFLGGEARGGKLLVTTRRLLFRPHRFNVQLAPWSTPLGSIVRVEPEGQRMLLVHVDGAREPAWLVTMKSKGLADYVARVGSAPEAARATIPFDPPEPSGSTQ